MATKPKPKTENNALLLKLMRGNLLKWLVMSTCLLAVALSPNALSTDSTDLSLTILHTNDIHAHLEPFIEHGKTVGGIARIAHLIRDFRQKEPDALVVDAGDIFQGTPLYTKYKGEPEVHALNMVGYDIYTIGNHEFDDGPENLAKQLAKAKFSIICCNMDASAVPALAALIKPYVIKKVKGQNVGFIGVMSPQFETLALNRNGVVLKAKDADWMKPIEEQIAALKEKGVNKIVLVSHCGLDNEKDMAKQLKDVDIIIGGHSHTRLDKPVIVDHGDSTSTVIVQAWSYGRVLGNLKVTFSADGVVQSDKVRYSLIPIRDRVPEEKSIKAYVDEKVKPLLPLRTDIAGYADGPFDNRFASMPFDSPIGNMICDALAYSGKEYGATISFQNRGGIRARMEAGPISMEKIEEMLPFDNRLVFATISGATVMGILERSFSGPLGGSFLDMHGLKVAFDFTRPKGQRLVYALAQDDDGSFKPLEKDKKYKIVINDYSFKGGEGYDFSGHEKPVYKKEKISDSLKAYLKYKGHIAPESPKRIVSVDTSIARLKVIGGGKRTVQIAGVKPGSKITLVIGSDRGVDSIGSRIAVPLADPKILKASAKANANGEFVWTVPSEVKSKWVCVVVQAPGKGSKRTVSGPIRLNAD